MFKCSRIFFKAAILFSLINQATLHAEPGILESNLELSIALDDPSLPGPFAVISYKDNLASAGYQSAIIFRPDGEGPFPATTLTPGYTNTKENIIWLGQHLASHGIITIVFTPTQIYKADASVWATGHIAAIETLKRENIRVGSPLAARVDTNNLGLTGYSFGAAGAVLAANQLQSEIKSVLALNAYRPALPVSRASYLFVVGKLDNVAIPGIVSRAFQAMDTKAPKAFANLKDLDHYGVLDRGNKHREFARLTTAWLKTYLMHDSRYMTFINGPELDEWIDGGQVFASPSDYIFVDGEPKILE